MPEISVLWGDPYWTSLPTELRLQQLSLDERMNFEVKLRQVPNVPAIEGDFRIGKQSDNAGYTSFGFFHVQDTLVEHYTAAREYLSRDESARSVFLLYEDGLQYGGYGRGYAFLNASNCQGSEYRFASLPKEARIQWNPFSAAITVGGAVNSPALILYHELLHGVHKAQDAIAYALRLITLSVHAPNFEEEITLLQERSCAKTLGEGIREFHGGWYYAVSGVTQTATDHAEEYRFEAFLQSLRVGRRNKHFLKRYPLWKTFSKTRPFLDYLYEQYAIYAELQDARHAFKTGFNSPEIQEHLRGLPMSTKMELVHGSVKVTDLLPSLTEAAISAGIL